MAKFYAMQIKMGRMELKDVPERWREATAKLLDK